MPPFWRVRLSSHLSQTYKSCIFLFSFLQKVSKKSGLFGFLRPSNKLFGSFFRGGKKKKKKRKKPTKNQQTNKPTNQGKKHQRNRETRSPFFLRAKKTPGGQRPRNLGTNSSRWQAPGRGFWGAAKSGFWGIFFFF